MSILSTPQSVAQVVTRRHPLAVASYTFTLILGLIFLVHWYGTRVDERVLFHGIPVWVIWSWKLELFLGSAAALVGVLARPRMSPHWPDIADLLHLEAIGAALSGFGLLTYAVAIVDLVGLHAASPDLAVFAPLIAGRFFRSVQALREGRSLESLAQALQDEEESNGD